MTDTDPEIPFEPIETGLADIEIVPTDELSAAPWHLVAHPNLDVRQVTKIARQVVTGVFQLDVILREVGISRDQFDRYIEPTELYKRVYDTFLLEWQSPLSTNKRIAILSAVLLEDGLMALAMRMVDANTPFNSAIEAAKALAKFAGIGEGTANQSLAPSERFTINIITSESKVSVAAAPPSSALPADGQGHSNLAPIRIESKRPGEV